MQKGELLGHVVHYDEVLATVLVAEDNIEKVLSNTVAIDARLVSASQQVYRGELKRSTPASTQQLPSAILSVKGGGPFAADPTAADQLKSYQRQYHLTIAIPNAPKSRLEERVHVLFWHDAEPLVHRLYRAVRRVFLRQLDV